MENNYLEQVEELNRVYTAKQRAYEAAVAKRELAESQLKTMEEDILRDYGVSGAELESLLIKEREALAAELADAKAVLGV